MECQFIYFGSVQSYANRFKTQGNILAFGVSGVQNIRGGNYDTRIIGSTNSVLPCPIEFDKVRDDAEYLRNEWKT
jgi:hypothetical protein